MPKIICNFKCKLCGDIFTATSENFSHCKCGMSEVKPSRCSTTYNPKKGWNCEVIIDENYLQYYFKSDFYIMTGEILDLFNQMKNLCKELEFNLYENFQYSENDEEFLEYISFTLDEDYNYYENNRMKFEVWFSKEMNYNFNEVDFKNRLLTFIDVLNKLKTKEIKLSDRKKLLEIDELCWHRERLKKYDYEFYI